MRQILVTGGAGFIGSNFIRFLFEKDPDIHVINIDLLTYAGSLKNLSNNDEARYTFIHGNIADPELIEDTLTKYSIDTIVNFAAETHVDRSILGPGAFIQTNIVGTFIILESIRNIWGNSNALLSQPYRLIHVSTDEVYGSLGPDDSPFTELSPYLPNSPYSASKASSDFLVRAYYQTYQLPVIVTNCSNNYGPYQFPEKLIPLMILNATTGKDLPVYGDGLQIRDWIHVQDHCQAVYEVIRNGRPGETYCIGGKSEKANIDIVLEICAILDEVRPLPSGKSYRSQIVHVTDRPGHDRRYAINSDKMKRELGWAPQKAFEAGLRETVTWYLENQQWVNGVMKENYAEWIDLNYSDRKEI